MTSRLRRKGAKAQRRKGAKAQRRKGAKAQRLYDLTDVTHTRNVFH